MRSLTAAVNATHPEAILLCWDGGEELWRRKFFPEYKSGRSPAGLSASESPVFGWCGLTSVSVPGYEADDLLAAAVRSMCEDDTMVIMSRDGDLHQLLDGDRVTQWVSANIWVTEAEMPVPPRGVPLFRSLVGDSSDGIPGVRRVGKKLATYLGEMYDWNTELLLEEDDDALPLVLPEGWRDVVRRNLILIDLRRSDLDLPVVELPSAWAGRNFPDEVAAVADDALRSAAVALCDAIKGGSGLP